MATTIDISGYTDPTGYTFSQVLVKASIREALAELLFPVMTKVLGHDKFRKGQINYFAQPSIDSAAPQDGGSNQDLPDLNIIFGEDSVAREQITTVNWDAESILTVTYYRKGYQNEGNLISYNARTINILVEDLEAAALLFDLQIQRAAQSGLLNGVIDTELTSINYSIPEQAGRVYGSVELAYNVKYQVDYRHLENKNLKE